MREYIQILVFVIIGVFLLWFGYSLFIGPISKIQHNRKPRLRKLTGTASPGDSQVCPICSFKLTKGDLVKTLAFPSITGGRDRLMHIQGCVNCLTEDVERKCPVCGSFLAYNDFLIARMFERSFRRHHVHVLGCNRCRRG